MTLYISPRRGPQWRRTRNQEWLLVPNCPLTIEGARVRKPLPRLVISVLAEKKTASPRFGMGSSSIYVFPDPVFTTANYTSSSNNAIDNFNVTIFFLCSNRGDLYPRLYDHRRICPDVPPTHQHHKRGERYLATHQYQGLAAPDILRERRVSFSRPAERANT